MSFGKRSDSELQSNDRGSRFVAWMSKAGPAAIWKNQHPAVVKEESDDGPGERSREVDIAIQSIERT